MSHMFWMGTSGKDYRCSKCGHWEPADVVMRPGCIKCPNCKKLARLDKIQARLSAGAFISRRNKSQPTQGTFLGFKGREMEFRCIDGDILVRAWHASLEDCRQPIRKNALANEQAAKLAEQATELAEFQELFDLQHWRMRKAEGEE